LFEGLTKINQVYSTDLQITILKYPAAELRGIFYSGHLPRFHKHEHTALAANAAFSFDGIHQAGGTPALSGDVAMIRYRNRLSRPACSRIQQEQYVGTASGPEGGNRPFRLD
jgi:hypothetical protein